MYCLVALTCFMNLSHILCIISYICFCLGQIAGAQITVYGSDKKVGDAAPTNLVEKGFWKTNKDQEKTWHMDVSFRAPDEMCTDEKLLSGSVGDRLIINQDTIKHNIPLLAGTAQEDKWSQGSCMAKMGQHHFYAL